MKFGVCTSLDNAPIFAQAGYSFIELNVLGDLKPEQAKNTIEADLEKIKKSPIPAKAANCFIPGHLRLVGDDVNRQRLESYAAQAFERAQKAGIETIVFGSGGARKIPDGFDRKKAYVQLVDFGKMIAPLAKAKQVTVVVEPLNTSETNIFNTVAESATFVRDVNHPAIKLLVDAYHWARENDSFDDLVESGPMLGHAHIATYTSRCAPGLEACSFDRFFAALKAGGYDGTLSIEGSWSGMPQQAKRSLDILEELAAKS